MFQFNLDVKLSVPAAQSHSDMVVLQVQLLPLTASPPARQSKCVL